MASLRDSYYPLGRPPHGVPHIRAVLIPAHAHGPVIRDSIWRH